MEAIVKSCNVAALLSLTLYTTWSIALFDLGHPTVVVPILNMAAMMIPVGLFYRPPPNMTLVTDFLFSCFAVVTSLMTTILTLSWWMGRFALVYPEPETVIDAPHDAARSWIYVIATVGALLGAGVALLVARTEKKAARSRRGRVFRLLRIAAWILAVREILLAAYIVTYPTPLVASVDSVSSMLIAAIVSWLVVPDLPALIAIPFLGYGVGLSLSAWVFEIRRTETFSDYLSANTMKTALEENRLINDAYNFGPSDVDYCCAMSLSYQLSTVYWLALGMALLAGVLPVPEKRTD